MLLNFAPALRDGWWGENADPGFRCAIPWAIFVFSLPGEFPNCLFLFLFLIPCSLIPSSPLSISYSLFPKSAPARAESFRLPRPCRGR
jgi:hypothetical protein